MKNILITGGSGLVGQVITQTLERNGYQVAWLSRNPEEYDQKAFKWDIANNYLDQAALDWADGIIHLAGAGVADERWTEERKKTILESRTQSTQLIFDQLRTIERRPSAFVSASAIGIYGFDTGDDLVNEASDPGDDFLAGVVKAWEKSVDQINTLGIRTVKLRIGIVLSKDGGALKEMLKPPVAAPLGSGNQYMSWIHIQDLADLFVFALENQHMSGVFNAVGPKPVSNSVLTKAAAEAKGKIYIGIPVPSFALKMALGELANVVIGGNRVSHDKIKSAGFKFHFTTIEAAVKDIFR
ncbi:TIGR01777 family oxidoreductase [Pararhodonellum marinum]|uniref:TIGR01777 family oxidoreductase n=1 Tax=Pararhodonellum marinum TaxID=2755358 RepID=UPI00188E5E36|nr:TIGR01777 family oxidoreductase [Pararhodonellum marinum]